MATISEAHSRSEIYSPLDPTRSEVRFIEIMPFTTNDQRVSCRLQTMELREDIPYAALSYVWGDSKVREDITVNGVNLPITVNLASALQHFSKNELPYNEETGKLNRLWVDAICINQADMKEKTHQVPLMGKLYENASAVLSWLGTPDSNHHDEALHIIHNIAPIIGVTPDCAYTEPSAKQIHVGFEWLKSTLGPLLDHNTHGISKTWVPIASLKENAYWVRVWIMQEMVMAKSNWAHWFVCGDGIATFAEVYTFSHFMASISETVFPENTIPLEDALWRDMTEIMGSMRGIDHAVMMRKMVRLRDNHPSLHIFRVACALSLHCSATQPHDYIYALVGLVPQSNIKMDYEKSVRDVYLSAATSSLDGRWGILELAGRGFDANNKYKLPSWVPDLTDLIPRMCFRDVRGNRNPLFNMETLPPPQSAASGALRIHGASCSSVEITKPLAFRSGRENNYKLLYQLCVDYLVDFFTPYLSMPEGLHRVARHMTGRSDGGRLLKTLFEVLDWERKDSSTKTQKFVELSGLELSSVAWAFFNLLLVHDALTQEEEECAKKRLGVSDLGSLMVSMFIDWNSLSVNIAEQDIAGRAELELWIANFAGRAELELWALNLRNRTLFKTDTGLLGIGPPMIRAGDLLYVVQDHSLPVLLRRVAEGDGASHLEHVGCCYVLGLSDGEPAGMIESGNLIIEVLEIQ